MPHGIEKTLPDVEITRGSKTKVKTVKDRLKSVFMIKHFYSSDFLCHIKVEMSFENNKPLSILESVGHRKTAMLTVLFHSNLGKHCNGKKSFELLLRSLVTCRWDYEWSKKEP